MDDLATRYADLLEGLAVRIRSLTIDRILRYSKLASAVVVVMALLLTAAVFLAIGLFRLVALWLGVQGAYLAVGGLFVAAGALLWTRRRPKDHR